MSPSLPASAIPWTLGAASGSTGLRWTAEDAQRLAVKGVIATPGGPFAVGQVPLKTGGSRCPLCGALKLIVRPLAEVARWCFGCGRASP